MVSNNFYLLRSCIASIIIIVIVFTALSAIAKEEQHIKTFIFEEQKIHGKIRRPQLVLIKADQRPEFQPLAIRMFGKNKNIVDFLDRSVIEDSPYSGPFQFEGRKISNRIP